jgi:hypothetical protein
LNAKTNGPKLVQVGKDGENIVPLKMNSLKRTLNTVMTFWTDLKRLPAIASHSSRQGLIGQCLSDIDHPMRICHRANFGDWITAQTGERIGQTVRWIIGLKEKFALEERNTWPNALLS